MGSRFPAPGGNIGLLGRADECAMLDALVADIHRGESRSLVLWGGPGIGKTALLDYVVESASRLTVVRAAGVESDMALDYAGLHQLCAPLLDRLGRLPGPQRNALEVVFGTSAGPPPGRFLVGLGVLSLLSAAAERRPALWVVDDAHWLDRATVLTLAFVARHLPSKPVGIVFATRAPGEELRRVPDLEVPGLRDGDARALLACAARVMLDARVRDRVIAEARGNPRALVELPRGLTVTQPAGGFGLLTAPRGQGRIDAGFLRRFASLPTDARLLLVAAAAEPVGDPLLLWRAADRLGVGPAALEAAQAHDLLTIGDRVTFRDPMVRSAVYREAAVSEQRAVHLALAESTDPELDPDRRAWHLAAAAASPDEAVARELEAWAGRARSRGGFPAAAAFLQRALALTGDPARRADRALAAAEASLSAADIEAARGLMATADIDSLDERQRGRLERLRAEAAYSESRGSDAPGLLLRAAKTLDRLDRRLARDTYVDAWSAALFAGRLASTGSLHQVSREALNAPRPAGRPRASDLLLDGFSLAFTDGRSAAAPVLARAAAGFAGDEASVEEVVRWGWLAAAAAMMVWDYESCRAVATRAARLARESGALTVLPVSVNVLAQAAALGGDWAGARSLVAEADRVTYATRGHVAPYGALVLAGLQGRETDAVTLIDGTTEAARAGGQGAAVQYANWARSVLLNGLGRYQEALTAAQAASDDAPELFVSSWALSEVIEAAVRTDEIARAEAGLERLARATSAAESDWGLGIEARARALLSEGHTAECSYAEAIERLRRTRLVPELARAHLLYGEWLRREHRRIDARAQLRTAHDQFVAIGMEAFAERACNELLATGEKVRRRTVEARDDLTTREREIAQLARDGLSNPEIGARLFLSPRTVEWHLRKVFTKLGIRSRRGLGDALPSAESQLALSEPVVTR